jgi:hypothetical protein
LTYDSSSSSFSEAVSIVSFSLGSNSWSCSCSWPLETDEFDERETEPEIDSMEQDERNNEGDKRASYKQNQNKQMSNNMYYVPILQWVRR